jgi:hypothetical protein
MEGDETSAPRKTRTYNPLIKNQRADSATRNFVSVSGDTPAVPSNTPSSPGRNDPDLLRLVEAWPALPPPVRAVLLALVESVSPAAKTDAAEWKGGP